MSLPLGSVSVTFDEDMIADSAGRPRLGARPGELHPHRRPPRQGRHPRAIAYDAASRTAVLTFDALDADRYVLKVGTGVKSSDGLPLAQAYSTDFEAVADFSSLITVRFTTADPTPPPGPSPTT